MRNTDGECAKYVACVWLNSLRSCKEVSNRQVGAPVAPREAPRGVGEGATIRRLTPAVRVEEPTLTSPCVLGAVANAVA